MKILFFGDSITDMARNRGVADGTVHAYGDGYVFMVATNLIGNNPKEFEIINRGESGNRIVDLYARIKRDVWNLEPDVLSILIGVNDVWHEIGSKNGVELDRWEKIYRSIIEETKKRLPNTKIMIVEPFVLKGSATQEKFTEFENVKEYARKAQLLASEYGLSFVKLQKTFDQLSEKNGVEYYLYDGVHPNIAGAKVIADAWLEVFNKML